MSSRDDLRSRLLLCGAVEVTAEYNGGGDDGMIDDVNARTLSGGAVELSDAVRDAIIDALGEVLDEPFAGWEINEGSQGFIAWNLCADKISIDHQWNVITTEDAYWEDAGYEVAPREAIVLPDVVTSGDNQEKVA
jgi:hypothetical protein